MSNSEVPLSKVQNNNFFKDLDKFEKGIVKKNDDWNCEVNSGKKIDYKNKNNYKNFNLSNDSNKRETENKIKNSSTPENDNKILSTKIKENLPKNRKIGNFANNQKIVFDDNFNNTDINKLKMGYCYLIKGYICNLKIFKKKKISISTKYNEYSKYENNFSSLIDYSNLIKMMIKLRFTLNKIFVRESQEEEKNKN